MPVAPGTAGSALAVATTALLAAILRTGPWLRLLVLIAAIVVASIGVWAATRAEVFFRKTDPHEVVIDEVAGQFLTLTALPNTSWVWLGIAFLLFRAFDIVKPFPARRAERLSGGWGIVTDDLVAGVYAAAVVFAAGKLLS